MRAGTDWRAVIRRAVECRAGHTRRSTHPSLARSATLTHDRLPAPMTGELGRSLRQVLCAEDASDIDDDPAENRAG
jgi:hypothetical protein